MAIPKKKHGDIYRVKVDKDSGRVTIEQWMGEDRYEKRDVDFEGKLTNFKLGSYTYKNKPEYKITLKLETEAGADYVEMNLNFLAKSLVNSLFGVEPGSTVSLSFYTKDSFANVFVKVNGEKGNWHWNIDQVKKANANGDVSWLKLAEELTKKYKDFKPVDELDTWAEKAQTLDVPKAEPEPEPIEADDDLPF